MKRHALFVGVDQYADPTIQNLRCAVNDATDLAGFFKHKANFDRSEALANPRSCEIVLDRAADLLEGLGPGDEFLFFFAGHGVNTQDGHHLVCAGDKLANVKHSWAGLPLERLKLETSCPCNRLFVLDACRTDVLATNRGVAGAMENGTRNLILGAAGPAEASVGALTILCSCDDGESAGEILSLHHGLFTMAMLELLEEEHHLGREVLVTDDFAYRLLPDRMHVLAEKEDMAFRQKPQKRGPPILLLNGSPQAPASYVVCHRCRRRKNPLDTFLCPGCNHDFCLDHQDADTFLCPDCAAKAREKAAREEAERKKAERARQEAAERERREQERREREEREKREAEERAREEAERNRPGAVLPVTIAGVPFNLRRIPAKGTQPAFWMGETQVTQALWTAVIGSNPSHFKKGDAYPVECVSWDDCQGFLKKLNALDEVRHAGLVFRLPTAEEWEYACRAGSRGKYCRLADGTEITEKTLDRVAWFDEDRHSGSTHPVGQKVPNAWGLCDMHGNVWEWTQTAVGEHRVLRGGGWLNSAEFCESSDRYGYSPGYRSSNLGFRLCVSGRADSAPGG